MLQRYSFFVLFGLLTSGLAWWSRSVEPSVGAGERVPAAAVVKRPEVSNASLEPQRRELLEVLDRIVAYEHYYHSVYGHFTKLLHRIGSSIPRSVGSIYEIRVIEATQERLLINALSEIDGKVSDIVSVDQDFKVHSSFPLPQPRAEFLRYRASRQLRQLWEAPSGQVFEEQGVFRGFFRFEIRRDSLDRKVAFAVGTRHPVLGLQLEYGPQQAEQDRIEGTELAADLITDLGEYSDRPQGTGQRSTGAVMSSSEEAILAQRIFRGEVGRYAKSWGELSKIVSFEFDEAVEPEPEVNRATASILAPRAKFRAEGGLEIEPITSENESAASLKN
ncbi:MAG: hypothetical protein NDJ90_02280 [Oligoflexia bacterium]|nr:hypothetical protein [Oligoflexia bacterium]